jgi:hypothetical protein
MSPVTATVTIAWRAKRPRSETPATQRYHPIRPIRVADENAQPPDRRNERGDSDAAERDLDRRLGV